MLVTITGYKIMHVFLRFAWIPAVNVIIICVGVGDKHLKQQVATEPVTPRTIISLASLVAGHMLPFDSTLGDYVVYMPPTAPKYVCFGSIDI